MLYGVAVGAQDDAFGGLPLNRLHAGTTGHQVRNICFFIAVVMMEVKRPVVVKTTTRAA